MELGSKRLVPSYLCLEELLMSLKLKIKSKIWIEKRSCERFLSKQKEI